MSEDNGVIRVGRKGHKKFAFGDSEPFEVDVVNTFQEWVAIDDGFRTETDRTIKTADLVAYNRAATEFVKGLAGEDITTAEALDFIARLREQYDDVASFFRPKSRDERELQDTSGAELRFSEEEQ